MCLRALKCLPVVAFLLVSTCWSNGAWGQTSASAVELYNSLNMNGNQTAVLDVNLKGADGQPVPVAAVVTLLKLSKEVYKQETAKAGHVHFGSIGATEYSVQVVAAGYKTAVSRVETRDNQVKTLTIELQKLSVEDAAEDLAYRALAPKAQKEIGKALELLRAQKVADARSHLDAANRAAPNQAEVQYLYGVYQKQAGNAEQAKAYWLKAVEYSPRHLLALLSLVDALLAENRETEALPYAKQAVEVEPSSWRGHMALANVHLRMGLVEEAVQEAERARELGQGQAAVVQPLLAVALARKGEKARAITTLQSYVQDHPSDAEAKTLLGKLQVGTASVTEVPHVDAASALPLPSNWLPPDVDEKVPAVEPGTPCVLDEVLRRAGKQVEEFVKNVDRFTASEFLKHESVNKWGLAESPETRKFDYVAGIEQYRPGYFSVTEYRSGVPSLSGFPDGVETTGMAALALIFHTNNAGNFAMSCEGLAQWNGKPAWQVHFRQRPDKPNTIRAYRFGENGPSYSVALRGRAWIAADTYQIVRMETDLIAPVPEIRLVTDHTLVDYGPVRFKRGDVEMWLPQSAELYCNWRGKRMHRRLSYSNYMLFSVDEKQKIAEPKQEKQKPQEN